MQCASLEVVDNELITFNRCQTYEPEACEQ